VTLTVADTPREVEVPEDFAAALAAADREVDLALPRREEALTCPAALVSRHP
jgi:hypothetical protein